MWFMGRSLEDQLSNHVGAHEAFMVSTPGLIWDMPADIVLDLHDDASLHDLAIIHHLLALKVTKQNGRSSTEPSEGSSLSNWLRQGTDVASSCVMEGHGPLSENAE